MIIEITMQWQRDVCLLDIPILYKICTHAVQFLDVFYSLRGL